MWCQSKWQRRCQRRSSGIQNATWTKFVTGSERLLFISETRCAGETRVLLEECRGSHLGRVDVPGRQHLPLLVPLDIQPSLDCSSSQSSHYLELSHALLVCLFPLLSPMRFQCLQPGFSLASQQLAIRSLINAVDQLQDLQLVVGNVFLKSILRATWNEKCSFRCLPCCHIFPSFRCTIC